MPAASLRRAVLLLALAACRSPPEVGRGVGRPETTETFLLRSTRLDETRRINVYLPPGYREHPAERYLVLYMPDGGMAEDFPHVIDAVQFGVTWEILRPMIVVGVENTERRRDLSGPTEVPSDLAMAPRVGGSARFRAFLRDELMPQVRSRYRASDETAIVGESLAGFFIVETFFLEPDLFDTYIAFSPSLWWNGEELVRNAAERLPAMSLQGKRLYMTSADEEDIVRETAALAKTLESVAPAGLTWFHFPMPDQFHDTIYRASAPKAFRILFPARA